MEMNSKTKGTLRFKRQNKKEKAKIKDIKGKNAKKFKPKVKSKISSGLF
jgi:hypothetical protein